MTKATMVLIVAALTSFAAPVFGFSMEVTTASSLSFDVQAAKNRPVSKVITLLKDMLKQLEKEAEEDEEIYDKMACWCETNDKEKTKAIADAEARISDLTTKIEELTAMSARLNTEIKNLEKEAVRENTSAAVHWGGTLPTPYTKILKQRFRRRKRRKKEEQKEGRRAGGKKSSSEVALARPTWGWCFEGADSDKIVTVAVRWAVSRQLRNRLLHITYGNASASEGPAITQVEEEDADNSSIADLWEEDVTSDDSSIAVLWKEEVTTIVDPFEDEATQGIDNFFIGDDAEADGCIKGDLEQQYETDWAQANDAASVDDDRQPPLVDGSSSQSPASSDSNNGLQELLKAKRVAKQRQQLEQELREARIRREAVEQHRERKKEEQKDHSRSAYRARRQKKKGRP